MRAANDPSQTIAFELRRSRVRQRETPNTATGLELKQGLSVTAEYCSISLPINRGNGAERLEAAK